MRRIKSLGYRTHLAVAVHDGIVEDRGDYWVVRDPSSPNFYSGNLLIFREAPKPGDLPRWEGIFDREIKAREPQTHHYTFGWDDPSGALGSAAEFQAAGYELEQDVVLTASEVVRPPKWNSEITVRKVRSDADWEEALQTQLEARSPDHGIEGFERYSRRQFARYRNMAEAGLGDWWGAFLGDKMVAGLGLYVAGELGRFQQVVTRKAFRRQGICGTLVHEVSRRVLAGGRFKTLVIVAAEQEHAVKIYQNVGYVFRERMVQVCKWKKGT